MRKLLFLILLFFASFILVSEAYSQSWGLSIGYGTSSTIHADVFYNKNANSYHIGGTYQFSDTRGKLVSEQKANYGREIDGRGKYFWSIDLGYGRYIFESFSINAELSVGSLENFTNYIDNRFNGGGYHMITESEITGGIGANLNYTISDYIIVFGGFNTLRKGTFGLRINIPTYSY